MKIKKGDKVTVTVGKDKGRQGVIERAYPKQTRVLVTGINIYKKHIKKSEKFPKGGVVELPRPIRVENIALVCPKCTKATKVGYQINKGNKYRVCKKCESRI